MDNENSDNRFKKCVDEEYKKILDTALLPSSIIMGEMKQQKESYLDFGIRKAAEHRMLEKSVSYQYYTVCTGKLAEL
jgi:glutamate--cysteine ligase